MAPAVSAEAAPVTPLSFLIKGITDFANGAASAIDSQGAASSIGRRLQQAPQQPLPQRPQPQPQPNPAQARRRIPTLHLLASGVVTA
jgi:hypothetical protein